MENWEPRSLDAVAVEEVLEDRDMAIGSSNAERCCFTLHPICGYLTNQGLCTRQNSIQSQKTSMIFWTLEQQKLFVADQLGR